MENRLSPSFTVIEGEGKKPTSYEAASTQLVTDMHHVFDDSQHPRKAQDLINLALKRARNSRQFSEAFLTERTNQVRILLRLLR